MRENAQENQRRVQETPPHLWNGRSYTTRHPLPVGDLMRLAEGKQPKYTLKQRLWFMLCSVKGHDLVTDRWSNSTNPNWLEEKDYELHIGCRRCPFMLTLDPKIYPEGL